MIGFLEAWGNVYELVHGDLVFLWSEVNIRKKLIQVLHYCWNRGPNRSALVSVYHLQSNLPLRPPVLNPMGGRPGLSGITVESPAAATVAANGGLSTWGFKRLPIRPQKV